MSGNDRTKWDYFFKMNVIEFLNNVTFHKDYTDYENKKISRLNEQFRS